MSAERLDVPAAAEADTTGRRPALSAAESPLGMALDALPNSSVMVFDADLRYLVVRGQAVRQQGLDPADIEGRLLWDALGPERAAFYEPLYRAALRGDINSVEVLSPTGTATYLVQIGPLRSATGEITGGISVATDITEQKRLEGNLLVWRQAFERSAIGIFVANPGTLRLESVNDAFAKMHGFAAEEMVGMPVAGMYAPEAWAALPERLRTVHEEGHVVFEAIHIRKDGSTFPAAMDISAVRDDHGELLYRVGFCQDITERHRAEEAVRRLAMVVESSDDAILTKDLDGIVLDWNAGAERLYGYTKVEAIGRPVSFLVPQGLQDEVPALLKRILAGEHIEHYDTARIRKDGSRVEVSLSFSPMLKDGTVVGASVIARDITKRREAEETLREALRLQEHATRHMQELNDMKDQFVAMVAHDLNSPMGIIVTAADTARLYWDRLDESQKLQILERIQANAETGVRLVADVLDVSRIESGQASRTVAPLDLAALVRRTVEDLAATHPAGRLRVKIASNLPRALADEQQQWQILTNLLTNALKFSPDSQPVEASVSRREGMLLVSVRDRGIGIAPEDLPKLFQRFSRLPSGVAQKGSGLGLFICKTLVESQGGTIDVQSAPGKGSTFSYTVPTETSGRTAGAAPAG